MAPSPSWNNGVGVGGASGPMDHQGDYGVEDERRSDLLKLVLYDLNSAIAPAEHRMTALQTALAELDHDQDWKHDEELDLHADKILFQKLAFAHTANPSSEEVALLCSALEMVYRASRQRVALSFSELREAVLPLFVQMLGKPTRHQKLEALEEAKKEAELLRQQAEGQQQQQRTADVAQAEGSTRSAATAGTSLGPSVADSYYPSKGGGGGGSGGTSYAEPYYNNYVDPNTLTTEQAAAMAAASYNESSTATFGDNDSLRKPVMQQQQDAPPGNNNNSATSYGADQQSTAYYGSQQSSRTREGSTDADESLAYSGDAEFSGEGLSYSGPHDNAFGNSVAQSVPGGGGVGSPTTNPYAPSYFAEGQDSYAQRQQEQQSTSYDASSASGMQASSSQQQFASYNQGYNDDGTAGGDASVQSSQGQVNGGSIDTTSIPEGAESSVASQEVTPDETMADSSDTLGANRSSFAGSVGIFTIDSEESSKLMGASLMGATATTTTSDAPAPKTFDPPEVETVTSDDDDEDVESYDYSVKKPYTSADDDSEISGITETGYKQDHLPPRHPSFRSMGSSGGNYSEPQFQSSALGQELETIGEATHEGSSAREDGSSKSTMYTNHKKAGSVYTNHNNSSISGSSFTTQRSLNASSRTTTTTTTSRHDARTLKDRKKERENKADHRVRLLEAELEMIRFDAPTNPVAVGRALQVLRYFSRVLSAMVPLAHHPGLLDSLVYQLERQPFGKYSEHFEVYDDSDGEPRSEFEKEELMAARMDAIATLVNLACAEENKAKVANHKGLLDAVTCVAQNDMSEEAREYSAIVIMNLAYEDENKIMMVEHPDMLSTLVRLLQDKSPFTRRYASAAMFTLACVVGNTERMASFCDGEILECLRRVLEQDPVDEARINASEALFNMARNNTEETVQRMGDHPQLLASLAKSVLTDYSADVRVYCARALEWMSADVHHPMPCHRTLLSALTVSAQWTKTSCIAEAFKTQATLEENRLPMAAHDGLLQALSNLALLDSLTDMDVRKASICALEMISREPAARIHMIHNEQVMRALTKASFEQNADGSDIYYSVDEGDEGASVTGQMIKEALKNLAHKL